VIRIPDQDHSGERLAQRARQQANLANLANLAVRR
jgi:hypothetical protein